MTESVVTHPVLIGTAEAALGNYTDTLQLGAIAASELTPGETAQMLHRDDWNWGHIRGRSHPLSRFTMIALTEFTVTTGGTRFIPGSHRWEDAYAASLDRKTWTKGIYEHQSFPSDAL